MSQKESKISELHTKEGTWKLVLRITDMWFERRNNGKSAIEMVFIDATGTKIRGSLSQDLFADFKDLLKEGSAYVIHNIKVIENTREYKVSTIPLMLYFVKSTSVEEVDRPDIPPNVRTITSFNDIFSGRAARDILVDIVGVVADVIEQPTLKPRRVTVKLRDTNGAEIFMTVWKDLANKFGLAIDKNRVDKKPIVVMLTLGKIKDATDKYPLTVENIKAGSKLFINDDVPEIRSFYQRLDLTTPFYIGLPSAEEGPSQSQSTPNSQSLRRMTREDVEHNLKVCLVERRWEEIVKIYENCPWTHTLVMNARGTTLHLAIILSEKEEVVRKLLNAVITEAQHPHKIDALEIESDEMRNTPLHDAAGNGWTKICQMIIGENNERIHLLNRKNRDGQTPLLYAFTAQHGTRQVFAYLSQISRDKHLNDEHLLLQGDGLSILGHAISRGYHDLALVILHYYPFLRTRPSHKGIKPLSLLNEKPKAFKSGSRLSWWKRIIYHFIVVKPLDPERQMKSYLKEMEQAQMNINHYFPKLYSTTASFGKLFGARHKQRDIENPLSNAQNKIILSSENSPTVFLGSSICGTFKRYAYATFQLVYAIFQLVYAIFQLAYKYTFGVLVGCFTELKKTKEKHQWSVQLLKELLKDKEHNFSAFLRAAETGIVEIVNETLSQNSQILGYWTSNKAPNGRNVLHVAVKNRQTLVVEALRIKLEQSQPELWMELVKAIDHDYNNILHLAAIAPTSDDDKPWQIAGSSALQMMWDLKWYQYAQSLLPPDMPPVNKSGKTAAQLFAEQHEELINSSSEWLKSTSESCSVVAALVAGVSFATASTVPGGNKDEGEPALEGEPVFNAFAIASLIGFYSSVASLVLFLSMMTSRNRANDFRRDLPLKLLLGLTFLFISIMALLVSFSTAHFFMLHDEFKTAQLIPIYGVSSLVVIFIVGQFQLYFDLLSTILTTLPHLVDDNFSGL